jgi:hypothetical protein
MYRCPLSTDVHDVIAGVARNRALTTSSNGCFIKLAPTAATKCPDGMEVASGDCKSAALSFGNTLKYGGIVEQGNWGHPPCGCFLAGDHTHYDHGSTCKAE